MIEHRKTISVAKNGEGTFVSINLRAWQAVLSFVGASLGTLGAIVGVALYMLRPQVDRWTAEKVAPAATIAQQTANTLSLHTAESLVVHARMDAAIANQRERADEALATVRDELKYIRQRVDEIARGR